MPAWTAGDGDNWADEIDYMLYYSKVNSWRACSLDKAQGKIITSTEVDPRTGMVTIYLKFPKDVGLTPCN